MKAPRLRRSFVLASLTQSDRVKWRDKTEADGKLNRKCPYQLTTVRTDTVGKRSGAGWQAWLNLPIALANTTTERGSVEIAEMVP